MRFVTLNLWGERGPVERRMVLVAEGLRALGADVIALQEVRELPGKLANQAETLGRELGMTCTLAPAMEWGGGTEGVALLTRGALHDVERLELPHANEALRRVVLAGRIQTAHGNVRVATTHLNYRLEQGLEREDQVLALCALLDRYPDETRVLLGDLNAVPDSDELRFLCGKTTLRGRRTYYQDAWAILHPEEPGLTWATRNPYTAPQHWLQPGRRLDYVLVSPEQRDGRATVEWSAIVMNVPDSSGVFPSDHFAVAADVRIG